MSLYFYKGTDISTIISRANPYNGNSKSILTNYYAQFPTISDATINNSNFDQCLNVDTGYSTGGVDIKNQIPSKVDFYQSTWNGNNTISMSISGIVDQTTCTFNNTCSNPECHAHPL
jgi:hypothetical protein